MLSEASTNYGRRRPGGVVVRLCQLFVDPVACRVRCDAERAADLGCEQLAGLLVKTVLGRRELRPAASPGLCFSACTISDDFGKADWCPIDDPFAGDP